MEYIVWCKSEALKAPPLQASVTNLAQNFKTTQSALHSAAAVRVPDKQRKKPRMQGIQGYKPINKITKSYYLHSTSRNQGLSIQAHTRRIKPMRMLGLQRQAYAVACCQLHIGCDAQG
jgi:hypothetical protein